jgi:hypothetical protein
MSGEMASSCCSSLQPTDDVSPTGRHTRRSEVIDRFGVPRVPVNAKPALNTFVPALVTPLELLGVDDEVSGN